MMGTAPPTSARRLRRSELATPASSPRMVAKAVVSAADVVFLDLEDAVAPQQKVAARSAVVAALNELDWGSKTRACRVNGPATRWCYGDLVDVVAGAGANLDLVVVPKVRGPRDVWFVDTLLTQLEMDLGLDAGHIRLEVLIEEAAALACVEEIAGCCPRVEALVLGVGDLSASQGMRQIVDGPVAPLVYPGYPGDVWHYARTRMVIAARAHGLAAVDGPVPDFNDDAAYLATATQAAVLGASGKWCIHPNQIPLANRVFSPSASEIDTARRAIAAMQQAEREGRGAASLDGALIDAATFRIHEVVLEQARLAGLLQE
ncbi:MAG: CoA ester lyase [Ilumatobacteraceae bacterium]